MPERHRPHMLSGLVWDETSAVDHSANLEEGWAVLKSRGSRRVVLDPVVLDMDVVTKAVDQQYTFGVVYRATEDKLDPDLDAHGDFILADELQKAQWQYTASGDRSIFLQHGVEGLVKVGEWVDICTWPQSVEVDLTVPGEKTRKTTIPAGSVWMGILWNDIGWPMIKEGTLRGLSLGGRAQKKERIMAKEKSGLEAEFEAFIANLKARMPAQKFDALMSLLRVLTAEAKDLANPAGSGMKSRVAPTTDQLMKLISDMRELDCDDDLVIHVLRFFGGNPENPEYGESGVDESEVGKAVRSTGLDEVVVKLVAHAHRQCGTPLVAGLDAKLVKGLDPEEAD